MKILGVARGPNDTDECVERIRRTTFKGTNHESTSTIVQRAAYRRWNGEAKVSERVRMEQRKEGEDSPLWCPLYCRTVSPEAISQRRAV